MPKPEGPDFFNLRLRATIPKGKCLYIQSGDSSDFDGYFIGAAGAVLSQHTAQLDFILVIPERRACSDRTETDPNKHEPAFSERVLDTAGHFFRHLCPDAVIVRGPLNTRNIIPHKGLFSEPEKYGPLLEGKELEPIRWHSVADLAALINADACTSVIMDMNGSMGYINDLVGLCPQLGAKLKASGVPVTIMAGVLAEVATTTLRLPGRDPRSTMNAIYSAQAVHTLLELASTSGVAVQFVTNNKCNQILQLQDAHDIVKQFELTGLLKDVALTWFETLMSIFPQMKGKCVPFDWVSFVAMLLHARYPELATVQRLQLWVGLNDPSVLVLRDPALPESEVVAANMLDTALWGEVESVTAVDKEALLHLARFVSADSAPVAPAAAAVAPAAPTAAATPAATAEAPAAATAAATAAPNRAAVGALPAAAPTASAAAAPAVAPPVPAAAAAATAAAAKRAGGGGALPPPQRSSLDDLFQWPPAAPLLVGGALAAVVITAVGALAVAALVYSRTPSSTAQPPRRS